MLLKKRRSRFTRFCRLPAQGIHTGREPAQAPFGVYVLAIKMLTGKIIERQISPVCRCTPELTAKYAGSSSFLAVLHFHQRFPWNRTTIESADVRFVEL